MATRDGNSLRRNFFHYEALATHQPSGAYKEFRILTILPGSGDDEIYCRLTHHPLPETADMPASIEYEALSWTSSGDDSSEVVDAIVIRDDGRRGNRHFPVRRDLKHALRSLRHRIKSRPIWVDWICVDKNNFAEKAAQVKLLFFIYGKAMNVCIWLGPHQDNSKTAIQFVQEQVNDLSTWNDMADRHLRDNWASLIALMQRPWFHDRWIVQHLALSSRATVHCGDSVMDWSEFETAVGLFEREAPRLAGVYQGVEDLFGDIQQMGATRLVRLQSNLFRLDEDRRVAEYRSSLHELVLNLSAFEAQDPLDLIYAVLSIARDTHRRVNVPPQWQEQNSPSEEDPPESPLTMAPSPLTGEAERRATVVVDMLRQNLARRTIFNIDYKMPFFLVCKQFLKHAIPAAQYSNLDILLRPWSPSRRRSGEMLALPSWIRTIDGAPFKRRLVKHAPGGYAMVRESCDTLVAQITHGTRHSPYNASQSPNAVRDEWKIFDGANDFRFIVSAFILDEIAHIQDASYMGNISQEWLELGGWQSGADGSRGQPSGGRSDALWRTLVGDRGPEGTEPPPYYYRAFLQATITSVEGINTSRLKLKGHPVLLEFLRRVEAMTTNRRLFKSAMNRSLGLAPKAAKDGDYICIVKGMSVPVVLRPVYEDSGDYYTLVGECYLHTFMNGRAIDLQARREETLAVELSRKVTELERLSVNREMSEMQRSKRAHSPTSPAPHSPTMERPRKKQKTKKRTLAQQASNTSNTASAEAGIPNEELRQVLQRQIKELRKEKDLVSWRKFELR